MPALAHACCIERKDLYIIITSDTKLFFGPDFATFPRSTSCWSSNKGSEVRKDIVHLEYSYKFRNLKPFSLSSFALDSNPSQGHEFLTTPTFAALITLPLSVNPLL